MKIRTTILAAGAILVLAAPALSASGGIPRDTTSGPTSTIKVAPASQLTNVLVENKSLAAAIKALRAKNKALSGRVAALTAETRSLAAEAGYLRWRLDVAEGRIVPTQGPTVDPDAECLDYVVCTPEQECRLWGSNCHVVQQPSTGEATETAPAAEGTPPAAAAISAGAGNVNVQCVSLADPPAVADGPSSYFDWTC